MLKKVKYLILGAGPAGLAFANRLLDNGETDFILLEKEPIAGGLCRSQEVDGSPFDIGGGHFLDTKDSTVTEFIFRFLPRSEWNLFPRKSMIDLYGELIDSPLEANIWQLNVEKQLEYLLDISRTGCNYGEKKPEAFVDWIRWKLGQKIADDYMLPYNRKIYGENLQQLGIYWLDKLPDVSFEDTMRSCLDKRAYGIQPGHQNFYYPKKYGYGEVWKRMASRIGEKLLNNYTAKQLDINKRSINNEYCADIIINTVPWTEFVIKGLDSTILDAIEELKYVSIITEYVPENKHTEAQWIYIPDEGKEYHRILVRKNFSRNARGFWKETNVSRFIKKYDNSIYFENKYSYPINTKRKPEIMALLLENCMQNNIIGLGRWGEWQHYNSDVVVKKAMELSDELIEGRNKVCK